MQLQAILKFSESDDFRCEIDYMDRSLNICRLTDSVMNSGFWSYFLKNMESAIGSSFHCPFKKKMFDIRNFSMVFPIIPVMRDVYLCATVKFFSKTANSRKFTNHMTATIHMSFLKD